MLVEVGDGSVRRDASLEHLAVQEQPSRDVRVPDQDKRRVRRGQRLEGDQLGQHVLPDGVARTAVKELSALDLRRRLERLEEAARRLAQLLRGPTGSLRSLGIELPERDLGGAERKEIMIPGEHEVRALAYEVAALVRAGSIPDGVAEAPDRVGRLALDLGEDGLERVKVGMDIRDDGDAHREIVGYYGCYGLLVRGCGAAVADRRAVRSSPLTSLGGRGLRQRLPGSQ